MRRHLFLRAGQKSSDAHGRRRLRRGSRGRVAGPERSRRHRGSSFRTSAPCRGLTDRRGARVPGRGAHGSQGDAGIDCARARAAASDARHRPASLPRGRSDHGARGERLADDPPCGSRAQPRSEVPRLSERPQLRPRPPCRGDDGEGPRAHRAGRLGLRFLHAGGRAQEGGDEGRRRRRQAPRRDGRWQRVRDRQAPADPGRDRLRRGAGDGLPRRPPCGPEAREAVPRLPPGWQRPATAGLGWLPVHARAERRGARRVRGAKGSPAVQVSLPLRLSGLLPRLRQGCRRERRQGRRRRLQRDPGPRNGAGDQAA